MLDVITTLLFLLAIVRLGRRDCCSDRRLGSGDDVGTKALATCVHVAEAVTMTQPMIGNVARRARGVAVALVIARRGAASVLRIYLKQMTSVCSKGSLHLVERVLRGRLLPTVICVVDKQIEVENAAR